MVSEEEFLSRYGKEGLSLEYKTASSKVPSDIWETYSAFANTEGGTIILGVAEDQSDGTLKVIGVDSPDTQVKRLWDTLNNPAKVSVNILKNKDIAVQEVDGKSVIIITVPPANRENKPVYLNGNIDCYTFKRNHEGDYVCRKDEVRSMMRDAYNDDQDNQPLTDIDGYDCFNKEDIRIYLSLLRNSEHLNGWSEQPTEDVLFMLGAVADKGGKMHPTRAGLLMFGKVPCILREFPNYRLDYREEISEGRYDYRLNSDQIGSELNVFRFLREVSSRLSMKVGVPFKLEGMVRRSDSEVLTAIREALVNTLLHADYRGNGGTTIVYSGKGVTFSNPGGMRIPIAKAVAGGVSDPRNRTMMRMLMGIGMVEQMGSGVRTIFGAVNDGTILDASIVEESDPLRTVTTIVFAPAGQKPDGLGTQFLRYVSEHPNASIKEISSVLGISTRTVSRIIAELTESGSLRREGNNRRNIWIVNS